MDMSQRRLELEYGTEITDKADEWQRNSISWQDCCRRIFLELAAEELVGAQLEISVVDEGCCGTLLGSGRDRVSATTFSGPGR